MQSPQKTSSRSGPTLTLRLAAFIFRHELKVLNLSLIIYLLFGVLLFEFLGEFQQRQPINQHSIQEKTHQSDIFNPGYKVNIKKELQLAESLADLREFSVRRMWNITNRLNILYESNWTQLMLDEIQAFETELLDRLMREAKLDEVLEINSADDDNSSDDSKSKRQKDKENKRVQSMKKSLIHSLSTITAIGSRSSEKIQSSIGRLATVIYGLIGIPLLFCSVLRTGKQVANLTLNSLLVVRHYCFSLPIHYLCCCCNISSCLRCLLWCCCCCCCTYLCCLSSDKKRNKCCDRKEAPKLRLRSVSSRETKLDGANHSSHGNETIKNRKQAAYVFETNLSDTLNNFNIPEEDRVSQQQKSVRFVNQNGGSAELKDDLIYKQKEESFNGSASRDKDQNSDEGLEFYTSGVFLTSLTALSVYVLMGAYLYSNYTDTSLIDALFVCYSILSTTNLPAHPRDLSSSHDQHRTYSDPRTLYNQLNNKSNTTTSKLTKANQLSGLESETIQWFYLLIGLNLISACGHFARLWLTSKSNPKECPLSIQDQIEDRKFQNGLLNRQLSGSFDSTSGHHFKDLQSIPPQDDHIGSVCAKVTSAQITDYDPQNQQVDLSQLFVVNGQGAQSIPADRMQFSQQQQSQLQPQPQQTSDVSFASTDRSTDRASLCQHHQAQITSSDPNQSLYPHTSYATNNHHARNPSQSHLYLSSLGLEGEQNSPQPSHHPHLHSRSHPHPHQHPDARLLLHNNNNSILDDETEEMDLMLKSCINGNGSKLRSSSSSTQLSHSNGTQLSSSLAGIASGSCYSGQTLGRHPHDHLLLRASADNTIHNGCEQDTIDTTTNTSNTMSSISSRTIKTPHQLRQQQPHQIGFILGHEQNN